LLIQVNIYLFIYLLLLLLLSTMRISHNNWLTNHCITHCNTLLIHYYIDLFKPHYVHINIHVKLLFLTFNLKTQITSKHINKFDIYKTQNLK